MRRPYEVRQFKHADGSPVTLGIGPTAVAGVGRPVAIIRPGEQTDMAKAQKTGAYENEKGERFHVNQGDPLPDGLRYAGEDDPLGDDETAVGERLPADDGRRAESGAPENRAETVPENRAKRG